MSIGKYSFEIYLIHLAYLILITKYIYKDTNFTNPSFLPVSVFLTLFLSYISAVIISKVGLMLKRYLTSAYSLVKNR